MLAPVFVHLQEDCAHRPGALLSLQLSQTIPFLDAAFLPGLSNLEPIQNKKHNSRKFNVKVANVILPLRKQGFTFKKIAEMLNEMKLYTAEGKQFHKSQVKRIVDRSLVEA